eukprot:scaffold7307_cov125-Isochrysis_galbana.AAC.1
MRLPAGRMRAMLQQPMAHIHSKGALKGKKDRGRRARKRKGGRATDIDSPSERCQRGATTPLDATHAGTNKTDKGQRSKGEGEDTRHATREAGNAGRVGVGMAEMAEDTTAAPSRAHVST